MIQALGTGRFLENFNNKLKKSLEDGERLMRPET